MSSTPQLHDRMYQTVTDYIGSYSAAFKTGDMTKLSQTLSPSCRRYLAPESMLAQAPDLAVGWTNDQYEAQCKKDLEPVAKQESEIKNIVIDETARTAAARAIQTVTNKTDGKTWAFEFSWFLDFNQDGTKITKIVHFIDTGLARDYIATFNVM